MKSTPTDPQTKSITTNPRDLMRARRPELFSDTQIATTHRLPKAAFEYHLNTLTSRKQEYEFEHFCRKLAEKEICPNLRTQTGPTGGGDSKVDSESYPVAEEISERWCIGEPSAGSELWGFAFSAKKAWKPKLKSDIESMLSTGKSYARIYFFTNQFVKDKARSETEIEYSKAFGTPVHVWDLMQIVEKVYANKHLELAISTLNIDGYTNESESKPGPNDVARIAQLDEIDKQVADPSRYENARYQLVEDCLQGALLARGLERPRHEIDARFLQADRLAKQSDFLQQRVRIAYNRAWTAYWWFEDFNAFNDHYSEVESLLANTTEASEAERLTTLWSILSTAVVLGRLESESARVEERLDRVIPLLMAMVANEARPNNALYAKTLLLFTEATVAHQNRDMTSLEEIWADLATVADESVPMPTYPVELLRKNVEALSEFVDSEAFDILYEKVTELVRKRRSDGEAGNAYRKRGMQKLENGKPYEAIRWLGRAEELLLKEEYQHDLIIALVSISRAYERAGLLWAARNKLLAAVGKIFDEFGREGDLPLLIFSLLNRLVWVELQLGRVPHVLLAMHLTNVVSRLIPLPDERKLKYADEVHDQDFVLGIHMLNTPFGVLKEVSRFPDVLDKVGLIAARLALLHALGQEQAILNEKYFPASKSEGEIRKYFEMWHEQPAAMDLGDHPTFIQGPSSTFRSVVLGVELVVDVASNEVSIGIAESLLGALEAFLATSDESDLLPHRGRVDISIRPEAGLNGMPQFDFDQSSSAIAYVTHPLEMPLATRAEIEGLSDWLYKTVGTLIAHQFVIHDVEAWMQRIAGDERAAARAILLGNMVTIDRNIFGHSPPVRLADWIRDEDQDYEVLRSAPWRTRTPASSSEVPLTFGTGPAPIELENSSQVKHSDRSVISPIDIDLWNRAKWTATLFGWSDDHPPILGPAFQNLEAGERIFKDWRDRLGEFDRANEIRIAIIVGVSAKNPNHYSFTIGSNPDSLAKSGVKRVVMVSRVNRMEPNSSMNLDGFLKAFRKFNAYFLAPSGIGSFSRNFRDVGLLKSHLQVRQAWEIDENDPDIAALREDDEPIIPPTEANPPVLRALDRIRNRRRKYGA
jgi:hypothetical protein